MPLMGCKKGGKSGYKFGEDGFCYTYEAGNEKSRRNAFAKAMKQGRAIKTNQTKDNKKKAGKKTVTRKKAGKKR